MDAFERGLLAMSNEPDKIKIDRLQRRLDEALLENQEMREALKEIETECRHCRVFARIALDLVGDGN